MDWLHLQLDAEPIELPKPERCLQFLYFPPDAVKGFLVYPLRFEGDRVRRAGPDLDPFPQLVRPPQKAGNLVFVLDGVGDAVAMPAPEAPTGKQDAHTPAAPRA